MPFTRYFINTQAKLSTVAPQLSTGCSHPLTRTSLNITARVEPLSGIVASTRYFVVIASLP